MKVLEIVILAFLMVYIRSEGDISFPPNSFELNPECTVHYDIDTNNNTITAAFEFRLPNRFFGMGFGTSMTNADIWTFEINGSEVVASDRWSYEHGPPSLDTDLVSENNLPGENNLELLGYSVSENGTIVKVRRALDTGDEFDTPITIGENNLIWSYGFGPMLQYHGPNHGTLTVNLIAPQAQTMTTTATNVSGGVAGSTDQKESDVVEGTSVLQSPITAILFLIFMIIGFN
mgnify:CR=1 FL=1|jgi:DOMON domain.